MSSCIVQNCSRAHYAKGLCEMHYQRKKKGQDLSAPVRNSISDAERFAQHFTIAETGCWLWNSTRKDGRAGTFILGGKVMAAYRASFLIHNGAMWKDLLVCHSCDNGRCVNPRHLWQGTYKDNMQDCVAKDRQSKAKGEARGKVAKLKEWQVREIRASGLSLRKLAERYDVSAWTIRDIKKRVTWPHI